MNYKILAAAMGVAPNVPEDCLTGQRTPTPEEHRELARVFGIDTAKHESPEWFLRDKELSMLNTISRMDALHDELEELVKLMEEDDDANHD